MKKYISSPHQSVSLNPELSKYVISLMISILLISGITCQKKDNPVAPPIISNNIKTGTSIDLATQFIGTQGGEVMVNKTGDSLNGLKIIIPPNSFPAGKTFTVSYAKIIDHKFGLYFNPISPMITIRYDGGMANDKMQIRIPIKLPTGHTANGWLYDKSTGEIEAIPLDDLNADVIVLSTRHFSTSNSIAKANSPFKTDGTTNEANIIVTSASKSLLNTQNIIPTNFTPGRDDWEFINFGSYIAPGGHCAGQSISAIWYYYEKYSKGKAPLFHQFDNINYNDQPARMWCDNPKGYRFASVIQTDMDFDNWVYRANFDQKYAGFVWDQLIYTMAQTKQPQLIIIRSSAKKSGHAVICYKIDVPQRLMYIADPNFPNNRAMDGTESIRTIHYNDNTSKFDPYPSSLNAASSTIMFDQIGFVGKSAYIDWGKIESRWLQFIYNSIGDDKFPHYTFTLFDSDGNELEDGYSTEDDSVMFVCRSEDCAEWIIGTDHLQYVEVYDDQGTFIVNTDSKGNGSVKLDKTVNKLGFYICGGRSGDWRYLDFKWITIKHQVLYIEPKNLNGKINTDYAFKARTEGTAPFSVKYVWAFGDGTNTVTKINDSTVVHRFTKAGTYDVSLQMYDNNSGTLKGTTKTKVYIAESSLLEKIQKAGIIWLDLEGCIFDWNPPTGSVPTPQDQFGLWTNTSSTISWKGNAFTITHSETYTIKNPPTYDSVVFSATMSGTVLSDVTKMTNLSVSYNTKKYSLCGNAVCIDKSVNLSLNCVNLPIVQDNLSNRFSIRAEGNTMKTATTSVSATYNWKTYPPAYEDKSGTHDASSFISYSVPKLYLDFYY